MLREKIKRQIRKIKEELLEINLKKSNGNNRNNLVEEYSKIIAKFSSFGSKDW